MARENKRRTAGPSPPARLKGAIFSRHGLAALVLAASVWAIYASSLPNSFVYDDMSYVVDPFQASNIRRLDFAGLREIFTTTHFTDYLPVNTLVYALQFKFYGPVHPWGYRITDISLHALDAVLVYLFLRMLLRNDLAAFAAALVFAVHPVNVESVAWVAEQKNVLSLAFFLAALMCYVRWDRTGGAGFYAAAVAFGVLATFSKSAAVVLPAVLVVYNLYSAPIGELLGRWRRLVLDKVPFILVSATGVALTLLSQGRKGVGIGMTFHLPFGVHVMAMVRAQFRYVASLVLPLWLAVDYPDHAFAYRPTGWTDPEVLAGLALLAAAGVVAIVSLARKRIGFFAVAWYVVTLSPVAGFVPFPTLRQDRYVYYPMIGLLAWVGLGFARLWSAAGRPGSRRVGRAALAGAGCLVVCLYAGLSVSYTFVWRNSETLWRNVLRYAPDSAKACDAVAGVLVAKRGEYLAAGRKADAERCRAEAVELLERAIGGYPGYLQSYNTYSAIYARDKDYVKAVGILDESIAAAQHTDNRVGIGQQYLARGDAYRAWGMHVEAEGNVREARRLYGEAVHDMREAARLGVVHGQKWSTLNALASVLSENLGKPDEALEVIEPLRSEWSLRPAMLDTAAWIYHLKGDEETAERLESEVMRELDSNPEVLYHYGAILAAGGKRSEGRKYLERALDRLGPGDAPLLRIRITRELERLGGAPDKSGERS